MAFICKSERVLKFTPTDVTPKPLEELSNPRVGPGAYLGHGRFSETRPSVAPFLSSHPREVSEVTNMNPGKAIKIDFRRSWRILSCCWV